MSDRETLSLVSEGRDVHQHPLRLISTVVASTHVLEESESAGSERTMLKGALRASRTKAVAEKGIEADEAAWQEEWWLGDVTAESTDFMRNREPKRLDW